MATQQKPNSQSIHEKKKNKAGGIMFPDFKSYEDAVIKTVQY